MALTIDGSNISFGGGGITLPLKVFTFQLNLNTVGWNTTTEGKYWQVFGDIPNFTYNQIIAVSHGDWYKIAKDQDVKPFVNNQGILGVLSNSNSFPTGSYIKLKILYV